MKKNVFSIVCSSPETNVTSFPVLVTASDFWDIFKILLYKTVATHLFMLTATSFECSVNPFLIKTDISAFNKKTMHLHDPSDAVSPLWIQWTSKVEFKYKHISKDSCINESKNNKISLCLYVAQITDIMLNFELFSSSWPLIMKTSDVWLYSFCSRPFIASLFFEFQVSLKDV